MPTAELTARPAAAPPTPSVPEGISWGTVIGLGVIHAAGLAGLVYLDPAARRWRRRSWPG